MAFRASILFVVLTLGVRPAGAQQHYLGATVQMDAQEVRSHAGRHTTYVCPAVTTTQIAGALIYGTDLYTADSPLCVAAVHAGVLGIGQAGPVTIVLASGADSFVGSTRNGVTSRAYTAYGASYRFHRGTQWGQVDWITTADHVPEEVTEPVVVFCPAGGTVFYPVWGTGTYTIDSSICMAAVHAGVIARESGGPVAVTRMPGQTMYPASVSNGVSSASWSAYRASFAVGTAGPIPPPGPPAPGVAPRLYVTPSSIVLEVRWLEIESASGYTLCRETPPGSTCVPVTHEAILTNGSYRLRDGPFAPRSMHAYRVSATHRDGSVGVARAVGENGDLGPPASASADFSLFAQRRQVRLDWQATGYVAHSGLSFFQTHLVTGPAMSRGQVVEGHHVYVYPPAGLDHYEWQICSMMDDGAGGWWYSPEARVLTYSIAQGTFSHSVAPCTRLPEGDGTIIIPPPEIPRR